MNTQHLHGTRSMQRRRDLLCPLPCPMKQIHLKLRGHSPRERDTRLCCQRRDVPINRYHRVRSSQ